MEKGLLMIATSFVALCVKAQVYVGGTLSYKSVDFNF